MTSNDTYRPPSTDWTHLSLACARARSALSPLTLAGHRVRLLDMRPFLVPPGWRIGIHAHSFYEAHLVLTGAAEMRFPHHRLVGPGMALLHAPQQQHAWQAADTHMLRLTFWFTVEPAVALSPPPVWPVWPEIPAQVEGLCRDALAQQPGWRDRVCAYTILILSRLLTLADLPEQPAPGREQLIEDVPGVVENFLSDNLALPLSLADIAAHCGMSERTLYRTFRRLTGETVMGRLHALRMVAAAEALRDTDLPAAEIARRVGLPDPSYFGKCFRRCYQLTPLQYRDARLDPA